MTRRQLLDTIRANPDVTVLIAGAGVNGAGLFRELALQGVDTLLVDKADFCAGTSAASSRLIHGGLRYLENGEFGLVRESLLERNLLLRNAAHYVKPLPTTIPIFAWTAGVFGAAARFFRLTAPKPANRGALLIKLGLTMYDLFTLGNRATPSHRFASRERALELRPQLNPEVVCTATYYDAWVTYPERLCLELVEDAEALSPHARATNYLRVEHAAGDRVTLRDEVTGETVEVRPKLLVNATGAWIDFTNRALGRPTKFIGGTKGSHLVLDHRELYEATRGEMLYFETEDGRVCLIFPFHDKVLAGTTDIRVDDPETARCDDGEVDYILQTVRAVFPSIAVDRSHVVFTYCGVRPLPSSESAITGQISRDHSCEVTPPGNGVTFPIYSLVGGKWTTFRAFAEQVADQVLDALGRTRRAGSEHLAIGGGKGYPRSDRASAALLGALREKTGLPRERLEALLERYGTRADAVAAYIAGGDDAPLRHHPDYSHREIEYLASRERVVHLDDLVLRRTAIALLGRLTADLLAELATIAGAALGWSEAEQQREIERAALILERNHGLKAADLLPAASRVSA